MNALELIRDKAMKLGATVVLPEGNDRRAVEAAGILAREGIVSPILLGGVAAIGGMEVALDTAVSIINPSSTELADEMAESYFQLRQHKGISLDDARVQIQNPLVFGAMWVRMGRADGCVAGAANATSDVLRAALQVIGLEAGNKLASSTFLMLLQDGRSLTYADCGMVPNPDAVQLAAIAIASAKTHTQLTGEAPRVAMLSFSTKGSAKHPDVDKVRETTALVREQAPELAVDGELQFDAAFVPAIGEKKAPNSAVAGHANVFIFPNLDAGNISYKITERIGGAQAIGPLIQGLAKPMHDLSRGCKVEDIVTTAAICAIQAHHSS